MQRVIDVASSFAATLARFGGGMAALSIGRRPVQRLILYDFESCPFCRKVREALTTLDLEAEIRPSPKRGHRFRDECIARGGKAQFPYLIDPNTGREMYESDDIVRYLHAEYGTRPASVLELGMLPVLTGSVASGLRGGNGTSAEPSVAPERLLELWSFEASPYCRLVRERLCVLELPYVLHNVGKGSAERDAFVRRSGKMQVPFLVDPNTGTELFESAAIIDHLDRTYARPRDSR
jgi:glutathione S-transferase